MEMLPGSESAGVPSPEPAASGGGSFLPDHNRQYLDKAYWDQRFEKEECYEWFKGYGSFRHLMLRHVRPSDRVLVVGNGNSRLSEDLFRDGVPRVTSTDVSEVVVEKMRRRCAANGCAAIEWRAADMLDLPFADGGFDVVVEKGAMDVLFVDDVSPWEPSPAARRRVAAMLREAHRVLGAGGLFISIAFGQPHFRRPLMEAEGLSWKMEYETFGDTFHYFFYTLRKGTRDLSLPYAAAGVLPPPGQSRAPLSMEHEYLDEEDYLLRTSAFGEQ